MELYTRTEDLRVDLLARTEAHEPLRRVTHADILVGIPSYNNARTIGHVVRAVQAGLSKYFPDRNAVIVNSDGGSADGTVDIVKKTEIKDFESILLRHRTEPALTLTFPHDGVPGRGSAFRAIFKLAASLGVDACAVVEADLRSITPGWIESLLKPVLVEGFDYVAPLYRRHKYDGTITNSIIYPLTRSLYGKRVRQPTGGDFGFSGRLAEFYLRKDAWDTDVVRHGLNVWMTTQAIANDFKVAQAFLGAKIHDPKDPAPDLGAMLHQVVGSTFALMESYDHIWKTVRGSLHVPTFGFQYEIGLEQVDVDVAMMLLVFREGVRNLRGIWTMIIGAGDFDIIRSLAALPDAEFRISSTLWASIIYDFALAHHKKKLSAEHLLRSLMPLYLGKTASFILEMRDRGQREAEAAVEKLCVEFEGNKDYLIHNWK